MQSQFLIGPSVQVILDSLDGPATIAPAQRNQAARLLLQVLGAVEIGHREAILSGIENDAGGVAVNSNHTHQEHRLRNAPADRDRVEWNAIDAGTRTRFVGRFIPAMLDGTHAFDHNGQTFLEATKRDDIEGIGSLTIGRDVPRKFGTTRVGHGSVFIEFDEKAGTATLYIKGTGYPLPSTIGRPSPLNDAIPIVAVD